MAFSFTYNPLTYQNAQKQVAGQIDPLYLRALENVQQQKYQNDVQSGQVAAARGLGHSGLAADQLNKNAIAAQSTIGDISAQRATQLAQMASDLMEKDKDRSMQSRAQQFNEYSSNRDYNYQLSRDKVSDMWKQREWSDMSPAEKARMALEYQYSKKSRGGGGGGGRRSTRSRSSVPSTSVNQAVAYSQSGKPQTAIDRYYSNPVIQQVESLKANNSLYNNVFKAPVAPAQNKYLSAWDKMKMMGM